MATTIEPTASPARERAGADARAAATAGADWVLSQLDANGQVAGSDAPDRYYKLPAALALNGYWNAAYRVLDYCARNVLAADGTLVLAAEVDAARPFNTYDRGWLAWGAMLCERYDLAAALAGDIRAYQDERTGGFWDSAGARHRREGLQGAMTAGMAGLGLLAAGEVEAARRSADFLAELWLDQPRGEDGFAAYRAVSAVWSGRDGGRPPLHDERSSIHYVDPNGQGQRPARFGPALGLLVRLYRRTGEERYLALACRYCDLFVAAPEQMYLSVECHKFVWGLVETEAARGDGAYVAAADRCVDYLVQAQQDDGSWLPEASAAGGEPSFGLVLGTTGNALVGLGYYGAFRGVS